MRRRPHARTAPRAGRGAEPDRARNLTAQGPVADDDQREPVCRLNQLAHALFGREPARNRISGGCASSPTSAGSSTPLGMIRTSSAPRRRASSTRAVDGASHQPCAPKHPPRESRSPPRQLDVRARDLDDERLSRRHRNDPRREPVRVDEIRAGRRSPRRAREAGEHQRQREREIRLLSEVPRHSRPVRDPVVTEARGRHDANVDAALADVLHLVGDEEARNISRPARVRRRQDDDLQDSRRRANTIGVARASRASA